MPRQSKNTRVNQLNTNACDQIETNIISHIESIGNSIIKELKGSKRNQLKQQLRNSCISNAITMTNNSSKRCFKQILNDLHTFNCHIQQEYRTVGIGDHDININKSEINETEKILKRKTRRTENLSQTIENETKKIPNIVKRTIYTRSSKLNNKPEEINHR